MNSEDNVMRLPNGSMAIFNGGNALNDCPSDWKAAEAMIEEWNDRAPIHAPKWSWDCGFKLDYDGDVLSIGSRFYPPRTHQGATWDGRLSVYLFGKIIHEKQFDCATLPELKDAVEAYAADIVKHFKSSIKVELP